MGVVNADGRPTDLELLHGVDEPLVALRARRAGALAVSLDGMDVRRVSYAGLEVVRRVYPAVRDTEWGTLPLRLGPAREAETPSGVRISATGEADDGAIGLDVELALAIAPDELRVELRAEARRSFAYCRIGLNVLLPPTAAGCAYATDGGISGAFPIEIAPQPWDAERQIFEPLFPSFSQLDVRFPGCSAAFAFAGDEFEIEDQRNWTDASFKVYSTPLRLGYPHEAEAGQRFDQHVIAAMVPA